jgi:hypothetical protein
MSAKTLTDEVARLRAFVAEQGSTTERYLHANRTSYPDMAELAEARMFPTAS